MTETTETAELEAGFSGGAPLLGLPEERWERLYYNSYGNYNGYRFQNFRAKCEHRDVERGGCNPACNNKAHPMAEDEDPECCCDLCPMVQKDYDDEDPDEPDYSEGEQPILVLKPNAKAQPRICRSEAKANTSAGAPGYALRSPDAQDLKCRTRPLSEPGLKLGWVEHEQQCKQLHELPVAQLDLER